MAPNTDTSCRKQRAARLFSARFRTLCDPVPPPRARVTEANLATLGASRAPNAPALSASAFRFAGRAGPGLSVSVEEIKCV